jgi:hypothetical protein
MTGFVHSLVRSLSAAVLTSIAAWAPWPEVNAQSTKPSVVPQSAATTKVILEVTATDFQIGPQQDYLYLRVYANHDAEA